MDFFANPRREYTNQNLFSNDDPSENGCLYPSFLWIGVGVQGLVMGFSQIFKGEKIAEYFGWPYSPSIKELGCANVAFGILGIFCLLIHEKWWLATGIGYSIFLLGSAQGHIFDAILRRNYSLSNIGPTLWAKLVIPATICVLLMLRYFIK